MIRRLVAALVMLGLAATLAVGLAVWRFVRGPAVFEAATVEIPRGASGYAVVRTLVDAGLLADSPLWTPWLRVTRAARCLQAGQHTLVARETPAQLFARLCGAATVPTRRLTVREGLTIWDLADLVELEQFAQRAAMLRLIDDEAFATEVGVAAGSLEGYLFPDTYDFERGASAEAIARRMVARFEQVWGALAAEHAEAIGALEREFGFARHDIVTLASIVEREAAVADERPRIAQVFLNRLRLGMPLQSDPTCIYNAERYHAVPTREDCRNPENTYSTYVIEALPPGPIASPGEASMRAVLAPSGETDILYFVSMNDGSGRHAFSNTLDEHNRNVRRYLR